MKQQIIRGLFALVALFFTVVSCRKDIQTVTTGPTQAKASIDEVKGNFHVENGILHFDDSKAFNDVLEQLRKFDISERRHFAAKQGFTSLLYAFNDVLKKSAEAADDEKTYDAILRDNSDIIDVRKDGTFQMRILNKRLASVLNREGIVYIDKSVYKFTDFGEVVIVDGDSDKLKTVTKTTASDNNIKVFAPNNLPIRSCGTYIWQNGVQNSSGDRAGDLWCETGFAYFLMTTFVNGNRVHLTDSFGNTLWEGVNGSYAVGTPWKKNWRGKWVNYRTDNSLSINHSMDVLSNGFCPTTDNFSYSNNWDAIDYMGSTCAQTKIPSPIVNSFSPKFISVNNSYSNQGGVTINLQCQ